MACINLKSNTAISLIEKINTKLDSLKFEREQFAKQKAIGAMIRSKATWQEFGEKSSKYFLSLEKANARKKVMSKIKNAKGDIIQDPKQILEEQCKFYESLYTSNPKVHFEMKVPSEVQISEIERQQMDIEITEQDLAHALKKTKRFKSAGSDGLPADFYIMFFGKLKNTLLDAYNYAFEVGRLHPSARQGIISLILKKSRDMNYLKNWRPICLLNADYKLISKAVSGKLTLFFDKLISKDQSGFIPGRDCSLNIQRAIDTLSYAEKHNINALLISIDFEKAFDRVEYQSLLGALTYFNFGAKIVYWIKILFREFSLVTVNNGYVSRPFISSRGLFQGNPVSSNCFIIIIELLAIMLRANKKIEGIPVGKYVSLLSMFADDMDIYIRNKNSVWEEVVKTIQKFEALSGMKVNYDKSTVYRLGAAKKTMAKTYSMNKLIWSDKPVNILGVKVSEDPTIMLEQNLRPLLIRTKAIFTTWKM